jgi:hypothetical protein
MELAFDLPVRQAIGAAQQNLGAENQTLGQRAFAYHGLQFLAVSLSQR